MECSSEKSEPGEHWVTHVGLLLLGNRFPPPRNSPGAHLKCSHVFRSRHMPSSAENLASSNKQRAAANRQMRKLYRNVPSWRKSTVAWGWVKNSWSRSSRVNKGLLDASSFKPGEDESNYLEWMVSNEIYQAPASMLNTGWTENFIVNINFIIVALGWYEFCGFWRQTLGDMEHACCMLSDFISVVYLDLNKYESINYIVLAIKSPRVTTTVHLFNQIAAKAPLIRVEWSFQWQLRTRSNLSCFPESLAVIL